MLFLFHFTVLHFLFEKTITKQPMLLKVLYKFDEVSFVMKHIAIILRHKILC